MDVLASLGLLDGGRPMRKQKRNKTKRKIKGQDRGPNKAQKTNTAAVYYNYRETNNALKLVEHKSPGPGDGTL